MSTGNLRVIFRPSARVISYGLPGWLLYDVYVEGKQIGLVADTGRGSTERPAENVWRPLEGSAYNKREALDRQQAAMAFVRWYYDERG